MSLGLQKGPPKDSQTAFKGTQTRFKKHAKACHVRECDILFGEAGNIRTHLLGFSFGARGWIISCRNRSEGPERRREAARSRSVSFSGEPVLRLVLSLFGKCAIVVNRCIVVDSA